jgi:hypothetical protein
VALVAASLKEDTMDGLHSSDASWTLDFLAAMHLISACERMQVNAVLGDVLLERCLDRAETIHLHIKVDDTDRLAAAALQAAGAVLDHGRTGFVKYRMPGRVNAIFSHIPVAEEDLRECDRNRRPRPFLDHIGIDVRSVDERSREAFGAVAGAAASRGWGHVAQGGAGRLVRCCHTVVDEKLWLFPAATGARPIEIAFGPLRESGGNPGCDLRPSHPANASSGGACCG